MSDPFWETKRWIIKEWKLIPSSLTAQGCIPMHWPIEYSRRSKGACKQRGEKPYLQDSVGEDAGETISPWSGVGSSPLV
jgi:hypothetical protein